MTTPATTPELEQRLREIETWADDLKWHNLSRQHLRFLVSALREALATVEKLGKLVDKQEQEIGK